MHTKIHAKLDGRSKVKPSMIRGDPCFTDSLLAAKDRMRSTCQIMRGSSGGEPEYVVYLVPCDESYGSFGTTQLPLNSKRGRYRNSHDGSVLN